MLFVLLKYIYKELMNDLLTLHAYLPLRYDYQLLCHDAGGGGGGGPGLNVIMTLSFLKNVWKCPLLKSAWAHPKHAKQLWKPLEPTITFYDMASWIDSVPLNFTIRCPPRSTVSVDWKGLISVFNVIACMCTCQCHAAHLGLPHHRDRLKIRHHCSYNVLLGIRVAY